MRPKLDWRAAVCGGALVIAYACAAAVPAPAPADTSQGTPTATASKVGVTHRQLNLKLGRSAARCRSAAVTAGSRSIVTAPTRAADIGCTIACAIP